jgi:hypothetical protein
MLLKDETGGDIEGDLEEYLSDQFFTPKDEEYKKVLTR